MGEAFSHTPSSTSETLAGYQGDSAEPEHKSRKG